MQARYYDPVIGRFYSNDPVDALGHMGRGNSIAHGFNRYAYANNNPYKYTDPDGEFGQFVVGALFSAGLELTVQLIENGGDISKVNGSKVVVAAGMGALGVGIGSKIDQFADGVKALTGSGAKATAANIGMNTGAATLTAGLENATNNLVDSVQNEGIQHDMGGDLASGAEGGLTNSSVSAGTGKMGLSGGKQQAVNQAVEATKKIVETVWKEE